MPIDFYDLPYDHSGTWSQKFDSIMSPGTKVTWPQFIVEMLIWNRTQILDNYKGIRIGKGWSNQIQNQVRKLNQQASSICNYFPHPDKEPLVIVAFKNFFRKFRPLKIGQYRKTRYTIKNNDKVLNITQDERDVIIGINEELEKLIKQRNIFAEVTPTQPKINPTFKTTSGSTKKNNLATLIELEKQIKNENQS